LKASLCWLPSLKRWRVYCRGGSTYLIQRNYKNKVDVEVIQKKFNIVNEMPPLKQIRAYLKGAKSCPGPKEATEACSKRNHPSIYCFQDIDTKAVLGACCSIGCLDKRYQSQDYIDKVKARRDTWAITERDRRHAAHAAYVGIRLTHAFQDNPFSEDKMKHFASLAFHNSYCRRSNCWSVRGLLIVVLSAWNMPVHIPRNQKEGWIMVHFIKQARGPCFLRVCNNHLLYRHASHAAFH
jgi:hypothetical protein